MKKTNYVNILLVVATAIISIIATAIICVSFTTDVETINEVNSDCVFSNDAETERYTTVTLISDDEVVLTKNVNMDDETEIKKLYFENKNEFKKVSVDTYDAYEMYMYGIGNSCGEIIIEK